MEKLKRTLWCNRNAFKPFPFVIFNEWLNGKKNYSLQLTITYCSFHLKMFCNFLPNKNSPIQMKSCRNKLKEKSLRLKRQTFQWLQFIIETKCSLNMEEKKNEKFRFMSAFGWHLLKIASLLMNKWMLSAHSFNSHLRKLFTFAICFNTYNTHTFSVSFFFCILRIWMM